EWTCSWSSAFYLVRFCCSSLTSARSARMISMVSFCFSMRLVCCVMISLRFRMSPTSSSSIVPLPSLPPASSNPPLSPLPVKVVVSFPCCSYSLVDLLGS
ncbi:hypothetical protein LTR41_012235, partial [Exophiala xenobiotica]